MCLAEGITKAAECVDHIKPHKGDMDLFWDSNNHQPLCIRHNSIKAATEEGAFGNKVKDERG
jgi:5-methylcytosine-specific restriction protein A